MSLQVTAVECELFRRGDDLLTYILRQVPRGEIQEKMILAVTSKIVSIAEGALVPADSVSSKVDLVQREADVFIGEIGYGCSLTVKNGLFIAAAGIDESNSENGDYILYPKDPYASARCLWQGLREAWGIEDLGILLTDSHTSPLRQGVTGICLSYHGFRPVRDMVGSKDLFGRTLKMTKLNLADGLSAAAVLTMGEGAECRPLALLHGAELEFADEGNPGALAMSLEEDLYYPLIREFMSARK